MNEKIHYRKYMPTDHLASYDLDGKDISVTIKSSGAEDVVGMDGRKTNLLVIHFLELKKGMVMNVTNSKQIEELYGSPYTADWIGKRITLYPAITILKGKKTDCLRIRPTKPIDAPPKLKVLKIEDSENFKKVKTFIDGGGSIDDVKTKWSISEEIERMLIP